MKSHRHPVPSTLLVVPPSLRPEKQLRGSHALPGRRRCPPHAITPSSLVDSAKALFVRLAVTIAGVFLETLARSRTLERREADLAFDRLGL